MFRTNIKGMNEAAWEMQRQIRKLNQAIGEAQDVRNGLRHLSGMDGIRRSLQKDISNMEVERQKLLRMMTGLRQIAECYNSCENRVVDYAEGVSYRGRRRMQFFTVNMPDNIQQLISNVLY
ncbi:MAG: hypothetical protein IJX66_11525 [Lachnospiraceae bacterium]|nr:hypothetical protein [Lachnospiraceae bacterium]